MRWMVCPVCCYCWPISDASDHYEDCHGEPVEVVPVPDEQAIERAARALEDWNWRSGSLTITSRMLVDAVLAVALEQPE